MRTSFILSFLLALILFLSKNTAHAQAEDTIRVTDLKEVTVTAFRLESQDLATPLALTTIGEYRLQNGQMQLALDEAMAAIPGVFAQNAHNFAQDIRVSIRGFGSRAAFGIRGIKILVDGFPETSPDGQGQVDNLDPAILTSLHVARGNTAGLYGNASGGQLHFTTLRFSEKKYGEAGWSLGSYGFMKEYLRIHSQAGKVQYSLNAVRTVIDGYRDHSAAKNYLLNGGVKIPFDSTLDLTLTVNYANSPVGQDAGALNLSEVDQNRRAARTRNVDFDAGESLWQLRTGALLTKRFSERETLQARAFLTRRRFSASLPLVPAEIVQLDRAFTGMNISYSRTGTFLGLPWEASLGTEVEYQHDDRSRFQNLEGNKGNLLLDQAEKFSTTGIFLSQKISLTERLQFFPGVRFDAMWLRTNDRFLQDGDDSGERNFYTLNPLLGLSYLVAEPISVYINVGSGFETPTFTEFANPSGAGGFNPGLGPQRSQNAEFGMKGRVAGGRIKYEIAAFHIRLTDELIPFEDDVQGRTFFRNAGRSRRNGLELGLGSYLGKGFYLYGNYTWSDFRFTEYETGGQDLSGNFLPGIPRHLSYLELRYFKTAGFHFTQTVQLVTSQWVDDANSFWTDHHVLANFRAGYRFRFLGTTAEFNLGINNLLNEQYFSNIRINGFAGRYYEPAPGTHFFGGMKVIFE